MPEKYGILVGVDGSAESDAAVRWATREAILRDELITLLHVVAPVIASWPEGPMQANFAKWQKESAQDVIEQAHMTLCAEVGEAPPEVRTGALDSQYSHVVPTLIDASKQARMVVAGSRGMGGVGSVPMGSVSTALVHHAHCPVAVIRGEEASAANQNAGVLVGIDGLPASEAATAWAFDQASRQGLPLVALHAWSDVGGLPDPLHGLAELRKPRRGSLNRTPGWLAGTVSQRARAATAGMGSARPQARRGIRARSAGGGRQSRPRRIRWHAAGLVRAAVAQSAKVPVVVVRTRSGDSAP